MERMNSQIIDGARALATCNVDVITYGCTTGSFFKGAGWDEEMQALMEKEASVPAIGTSPAVVAALRHFGANGPCWARVGPVLGPARARGPGPGPGAWARPRPMVLGPALGPWAWAWARAQIFGKNWAKKLGKL